MGYLIWHIKLWKLKKGQRMGNCWRLRKLKNWEIAIIIRVWGSLLWEVFIKINRIKTPSRKKLLNLRRGKKVCLRPIVLIKTASKIHTCLKQVYSVKIYLEMNLCSAPSVSTTKYLPRKSKTHSFPWTPTPTFLDPRKPSPISMINSSPILLCTYPRNKKKVNKMVSKRKWISSAKTGNKTVEKRRMLHLTEKNLAKVWTI